MTLGENLVSINKLRATIDELRPLSAQAQNELWQKLRLEWNYNSNHIEGNTLTYGETKLLLLFDKTTGDHEKREYDEMQAHDAAIHLVRDWAADKGRELTETDIKDLNRIILVKPYWKEAETFDGQPTRRLIRVGDYKEFPNSVRLKNGEIFNYASPQETHRLMQELMEWYRTTEIQHPVYLAAELHYRFIRIHPFDDGNGRVARLLVNYVQMRHGYTPLIIKSADKSNYLTALQKADAGDKSAFHNYIAEQQIWSLELERKAAIGESLEEPDDIDKEIELLKKHSQRVTKLVERGTSQEIIKTINDNIIPLFKMLESKADDLRDLFMDYSRNITVQLLGTPAATVLGGDLHWNSFFAWLTDIKEANKQINTINYNYQLSGLKQTLDGRNYYFNIQVNFESYNYKIKTPLTNQPLIFPYGKPILETDCRNIINPILKEAIRSIKEAK